MPVRERRQSHEDRERYDDTTKCILCAACTSSCPSFWAQDTYVGPAAIVNAHRFIFDTRDAGSDERLEILSDADGVWRCRTIFNCTDACPRGINITRAILEVSAGHHGAWGLKLPDADGMESVEDAEDEARLPRRQFERLVIRTDGASRGNPGRSSAGAVLIDASRPDAFEPDAMAIAVVARDWGSDQQRGGIRRPGAGVARSGTAGRARRSTCASTPSSSWSS